MADGTIYAGTSPDAGKPTFAMPQDAAEVDDGGTGERAMEYAEALDAHGP